MKVRPLRVQNKKEGTAARTNFNGFNPAVRARSILYLAVPFPRLAAFLASGVRSLDQFRASLRVARCKVPCLLARRAPEPGIPRLPVLQHALHFRPHLPEELFKFLCHSFLPAAAGRCDALNLSVNGTVLPTASRSGLSLGQRNQLTRPRWLNGRVLCKMGKVEGGFALHSPQGVANLTNRQGYWEPLGLGKSAGLPG